MSKPVLMIGNGGHAAVLTELLIAQQIDILGFTAPEQEPNCFELSYLGSDECISSYNPSQIELVLAIGMIKPSPLREDIFNRFTEAGYSFRTVIHPSTIIAPSVLIGQGVQIMAGVIIQTNTVISDNCIINTGSLIDHNCRIESNVHIAPGSKISGNVSIGKGTHIGTGATVINGVNVGANCLIGAGAVVVKDIANHIKAVGVPAKEVYKQ